MKTENVKSNFKTRFAPSPTGLMHFGNVRTALFNYLYALKHQGHFLLRVEDTDVARSEMQYRDAILRDLEWLGIEWQEGPYHQSERQAIYQEYYQQLEEKELVYPCFCSEEELALTRKLQLNAGKPPRYPGTCRNLSKEEVQKKIHAGLKPTLRFKVSLGEVVTFQDLIKGDERFETSHIGDFIIRRNDNSASFMFCNAIDDALMGVTHALRGDDHLANTPRQLLILKALGLQAPQYAHFPTILGPDGRPLSKRNGSRSIHELREAGYHPMAIMNYLSRLGHYDPDNTFLTKQGLSEHFKLENISRSAAHYDEAQLHFWQKEAMHHASFEECWAMIEKEVSGYMPESSRKPFVEAVKPNLLMPKEATFWAIAIFDEIIPFEEDARKVIKETGPDFFIKASEILKSHNIDSHSIDYNIFIKKLQEGTNQKGKQLFFPLRAALTGALHGPELAKIFDIMGKDRMHRRFLDAENEAIKEAEHGSH